MIPFHKNTFQQLQIQQNKTVQNGEAYCKAWFKKELGLENFYFTKSCTQSLELSLMILDLPVGSEVILPSYSFVSLANAINNLNLQCVFVDIEENTMNINADKLEEAINEKTRAVMVINYGGVGCDFNRLQTICKKHNLYLIEDNAHGLKCKYNDQFLGSFGDVSTFSFDHMKNITSFQGGGISINNTELLNRYFIASEFGTNRKACLEGEVNAYEWIGKGTNSIMPEPLFDILATQLSKHEEILSDLKNTWKLYEQLMAPLEQGSYIKLLQVPEKRQHIPHMFWLKTSSDAQALDLIHFLKNKNIGSSRHYTPLHSSPFGKLHGKTYYDLSQCESESNKLVRLPHYYRMNKEEVYEVVSTVFQFYNKPFTP